VVIGAAENSVVFDWEPTMAAGAELLSGPRGTDVRLDNMHRPTREEKRTDYAERRAGKAAAQDQLRAERKAGHWATAATGLEAHADAEGPADASADALAAPAAASPAETPAVDETSPGA
jgi:GTP-binding protein